MLRFLSIRDFVIVDSVELEFGRGFTALTGETGAGKSILIDALALTLGERADSGVVRAGRERADISAEFDASNLPGVLDWLRENELEGDAGVCLLRRVVETSGRSRAFVNGRPATAQQLKEAGERLVDIHGQHAHQSLLRSDAQREVLDALGGHLDQAREVAAAYKQWQGFKATRLAWQENAAALAREREQLEFQAQELESLAFSTDEWRELNAEHSRLSHSASLLEAAQFAVDALDEGAEACLKRLHGVSGRLSGLLDYDPKLKEVLELLQPAQIQLQEALYSLNRYLQGLDLDPRRLEQLEQRVSAIHGLARKHRVAPEDLPGLLERWQARLAEIGGGADEEALLQREQAARDGYSKLARELSQGRKKSAAKLSQEVTAALQDLAMGGGQFAAALIPLPEGNGHGLEQVEFRVAPHAGVPLKPLAKVASGGELSRISLAIQVIISKVAAVPTLIFDEVDAGIGGKVAEIVGRLLKQLGKAHQVMCVTHLPQVAASADHQWQVAKGAVDGSVLSSIRVLDRDERVEEIARMLGGVKITQTTRRHAAEMLTNVRRET